MGRTTIKFRSLCPHSSPPWHSIKSSQPTIYNSTSSPKTHGENNALDEISDDSGPTTDDDEDNLISEINLKANQYQLCTAKVAHDAILGKKDAAVAKRMLTSTEAPALGYKVLDYETM